MTPDIQFFPVSGTWVKPAGAVRVDYLICAAGAGGSVGVGEIGRDGEAGALHSGSFEAGKIPDEVKVEIGRGGRGAAIGPVKAGDGADGYALFVTRLAEEPESDLSPMVARPRARAAESAIDAALAIRTGDIGEARGLLREAEFELDLAERRAGEAAAR